MEYHLCQPKVIHFDYEQKINVPIGKLRFSFEPMFPIYEYEGKDMPNYFRAHRVELRWTFRMHENERVVLSFIAEQICVLVYYDDPLNKLKFANLLMVAHHAVALEFDMLKPDNWISDVSVIGLPPDYLDFEQFDSLLKHMKQRADSNI